MAKKPATPAADAPARPPRWVCEHYELGEERKFTPGRDTYRGTRGFADVTFVRPRHLRDLLRLLWEVKRDTGREVMLCVTANEDNGHGGTRLHAYEGVYVNGWTSGPGDAATGPTETVEIRMDDRYAHGVRHYYWSLPLSAVERVMVTIDANDPLPHKTVQPPPGS